MRVLFIYTDSAAPSCVASASNIVKIEEVTENNVEVLKCTDSNSAVTTFPKSRGQLSLLWE